MPTRLLVLLCLVVAVGVAAPAALAAPERGLPRTIETTVGEEGILRLMSNARKAEHWVWLRKPDARIVKINPPEQLPENDEAVNGLAGRTAISVRGRRVGTTTALIGYVTRHQKTLLRTVALTIVVR
ncbi:MAG: hypothetical protein ACR2JV_06395 [Gaiellales bacterium]